MNGKVHANRKRRKVWRSLLRGLPFWELTHRMPFRWFPGRKSAPELRLNRNMGDAVGLVSEPLAVNRRSGDPQRCQLRVKMIKL